MRETREYAWVHFAAVNLVKGAVHAAAEADKMLAEFDRRFGPCPNCKGNGRQYSNDGTPATVCESCKGTGDRPST